MSLINDALKQARKNPPPTPPGSRLPLQPVIGQAVSKYFWVVPALIGLVMFIAVTLILWATFHKTRDHLSDTATDTEQTNMVEDTTPTTLSPAPEPAPVEPAPLPTLQGIFYSPTAPTAIIDGKTVGVGDQFRQYRVKEITKNTATIIGPDGKAIKLTMIN
jgi:hypothetical protein